MSFALAIGGIGFIVDALAGAWVSSGISACLVLGAGVLYWRVRAQPDLLDFEIVHRLIYIIALLALIHGTGIETLEAGCAAK